MPGATWVTANWAPRRRGAEAQRSERTTVARRRIRTLRGRAKFRDMSINRDVLGTIGNTSCVELRLVVPPGCARIVVKVEGENPTGSMKDRMAQAMVAR